MTIPRGFARTNSLRIALAIHAASAAVAVNAAILAKVIGAARAIARGGIARAVSGTIVGTSLELAELAVKFGVADTATV